MSKYYKAEDVIRKRAEDLADTSYWEYGNPKNVDEWIEVAEMEFKDLPTIEVSEDCISRDGLLKHAYKREGVLSVSVESIKLAPSVVPTVRKNRQVERAEGEWLLDGRCSNCLQAPLTTHKNFCPNCGADMRPTERDSNV